MKNFKYVIGAATLLLATSALAGGPEVAPEIKHGFYINANGGVDFLSPNNPYNNVGWNGGLALGYRYSQIRVELAGSYLAHGANSAFRNWALPVAYFGIPFGGGAITFGQLQMADVLLNGYYDFNLNSNVIPYLGLGLGYLHAWSNATIAGNANLFNPFNNNGRWNSNADSMAFQGIVGLDYQFNDHVRLGLSYHALGWTRTYKFLPGITTGLLLTSVNNPTRFENLLNLGISYFF